MPISIHRTLDEIEAEVSEAWLEFEFMQRQGHKYLKEIAEHYDTLNRAIKEVESWVEKWDNRETFDYETFLYKTKQRRDIIKTWIEGNANA